jgi:hypothetical protein
MQNTDSSYASPFHFGWRKAEVRCGLRAPSIFPVFLTYQKLHKLFRMLLVSLPVLLLHMLLAALPVCLMHHMLFRMLRLPVYLRSSLQCLIMPSHLPP